MNGGQKLLGFLLGFLHGPKIAVSLLARALELDELGMSGSKVAAR